MENFLRKVAAALVYCGWIIGSAFLGLGCAVTAGPPFLGIGSTFSPFSPYPMSETIIL